MQEEGTEHSNEDSHDSMGCPVKGREELVQE